jgi:cytochrome d ubiquinol oxidase subunit II
MLILFSFVIQAVSYEFQNKLGNFLGPTVFQVCLVINGIVGPLLLGGAVSTFFQGSNFVIVKADMTNQAAPIISRWANASNGLDALLDPWNLLLGLAVFFLSRLLGLLYMKNNVDDDFIQERAVKILKVETPIFVVAFVAYLVHMVLKDGFAVDPATGTIFMEPYKYLHNLTEMWYVTAILLIGVVLVLYGVLGTILKPSWRKGIWAAGFGTVLTVLALFLCAGWNNTAYYPSNFDLQSSLTIANSSSSPFTLKTMFWVSMFIPFVIAYIVYAWKSINKKPITEDEIRNDEAY